MITDQFDGTDKLLLAAVQTDATVIVLTNYIVVYAVHASSSSIRYHLRRQL